MAEGTSMSNQFPVIWPGGLYTQQQVISLLGVSKATLQRWHRAGLKRCQPATDQVYYFADDILAVMRLDRGEIVEAEQEE